MRVPELGFGGGPLGGLFEPLDDATAAAALSAAWDGGIRYYDTSPHYGIGHSERRMGELLRDKPRDEFVLSTKVGRLLVPQDPQGRMDEAFPVLGMRTTAEVEQNLAAFNAEIPEELWAELARA